MRLVCTTLYAPSPPHCAPSIELYSSSTDTSTLTHILHCIQDGKGVLTTAVDCAYKAHTRRIQLKTECIQDDRIEDREDLNGFPLFFHFFLVFLYRWRHTPSLHVRPSSSSSKSMRKDWDCIVVGAVLGVLGTSLAIVLGRQGRQTLLLERDLSEPDRIVGELLQPGGVAALHALQLDGVLEGIGAIRVHGYHIMMGNEQLRLPYEREGLDRGGRSFHHGRFIQRLRDQAQKEPYVRLIEATVIDTVENSATGHVLGVATRSKATGLLKHVSYRPGNEASVRRIVNFSFIILDDH
ncbi:hypothetical protein PCK1_001052 [Pneumocystis canis]|nr:hypothetical protein PCK1_001052 [Pneumocystis canis]